MTGSLFPFVRHLVLFHLFHFWRLGSLLFPCELGVFSLSLVNTGSMIAVCESLLSYCIDQPLALVFTIFGVFFFVCCFGVVSPKAASGAPSAAPASDELCDEYPQPGSFRCLEAVSLREMRSNILARQQSRKSFQKELYQC